MRERNPAEEGELAARRDNAAAREREREEAAEKRDPRFTEFGQYDGGNAVWYERKGRIYIDILEAGPTSRLVTRIFRKDGRMARRNEVFPIHELRRIMPLSSRGLGDTLNKLADRPEPLTDLALDFVDLNAEPDRSCVECWAEPGEPHLPACSVRLTAEAAAAAAEPAPEPPNVPDPAEQAKRGDRPIPVREKPDASKAYDATKARIDESLRAIGEGLEEHRREQAEQPGSWSFLGDLGYLDATLSEICETFRWGKYR